MNDVIFELRFVGNEPFECASLLPEGVADHLEMALTDLRFTLPVMPQVNYVLILSSFYHLISYPLTEEEMDWLLSGSATRIVDIALRSDCVVLYCTADKEYTLTY